MNNLLAIDYGERFVGIAIRTLKTTIPIPLKVIDSKKETINKSIQLIIKEYDINEIIIGYPIGLNNSENRMTKLVNIFIKEIGKFNIPIYKIDERLSSKLFSDGSKDRIDDLSALEILESYIKQND
uniref:Putative pre-16S rRNA nuclease n=1 Tax=Candidatus Actinomarina minuta TaxID=1389454 RepID=S5DY40_9ACTN|nr:putative endonuclease [Candidatus Actinomarina minuta]